MQIGFKCVPPFRESKFVGLFFFRFRSEVEDLDVFLDHVISGD